MAYIIQGMIVIILAYFSCIYCLCFGTYTYFYVKKIQSVDIILLHFTINVGLFRQVFKICYCDQFSAENESKYRYICTSFIESVKNVFQSN